MIIPYCGYKSYWNNIVYLEIILKMPLILFCLLFLSFNGFSQYAHKDTPVQSQHIRNDELRRQVADSKQIMDTLFNGTYKKIQDDAMKRSLEQNNRNLESFMAGQREQQEKLKKRMWLRIGLGILFLIIGIVGFTRKKHS